MYVGEYFCSVRKSCRWQGCYAEANKAGKKNKNGEKPPVNLNEILKQVDMNAFKENKTKQRLHKQQDDDIKRPN